MNGFVPALIAVMLAELGPRIAAIKAAERRERIVWTIAALVFVAGAAGTLVAPMLSGWADLLMIGFALVLAGAGQVQRVVRHAGTLRTLATFWGGGTLLLTFALAARFGALAASFGALAGLAAATALGQIAAPGRLRLAAAVILILAGLACTAAGLRLV